MTDTPRLIEFAFPLKQASLDSVHEKNVRHGHISTLHIWPARRPLAACRAALIATLLPDPSAAPKPDGMTDDEWQKEIQKRRQAICEKIAGRVIKKHEKKKMPGGQIVEREKEATVGGILRWLGEEPASGGKKKLQEWRDRKEQTDTDLVWFREEIRKAYGGRAPKVLDPFAGGGAIPLEAMRLGCEATAIDINPVAWFILKCTLEYPQKLAGQMLPLPEFILDNEAFMTVFYQAHPHLIGRTKRTKKQAKEARRDLFEHTKKDTGRAPKADLAWHVRAWGQWVLDKARRELARFYPVYADFEPLKKGEKSYETQEMRLVPLKEDGTPDIDSLNAEFSKEYLAVKSNPRWVAKPTVAYLWARTVKCKNCRATIPLLKTRWLSKKDSKRTLLTISPNKSKSDVVFGIDSDLSVKGNNAAQIREHDKRIGKGTMTRAGADCLCCGLKGIMTMEDIRIRGKAGELGEVLTAVVIDTPEGRGYRQPTPHELSSVCDVGNAIGPLFATIPHGPICEPLEPESTRSISCQLYGIDNFSKVFTQRQQFALGTLARQVLRVRELQTEMKSPIEWRDAITSALSLGVDRVADRMSVFCQPDPSPTQSGVMHTFARFSFPMGWDYIEAVPHSDASGGFIGSLEWIAIVIEHLNHATSNAPASIVSNASAAEQQTHEQYDVIFTDPPYYQAISYADLADYFYIWLRRMHDVPEFSAPLSDKSKEIVQHIRSDKDKNVEKKKYEDGMSTAFEKAYISLKPNGRFVIVFAHKESDAWETLVTAMIRAGFIVTASWPIETERAARSRALSTASLASSVWLVCKKRHITARAGWDNKVLDDMRLNIAARLRDFWDAGIRGPDFVWAATGPALEAYSKHPVVKMANDPGKVLTVSEFLNHARRMVVDFVVGRVLEKSGDSAGVGAVDRLDEATAYYLLHRNDFGLDEAPVGACILYATACGLSDQELMRDWDLLAKTGGDTEPEPDDEEDDDEPAEETGSGGKVKLKAWNQRRARSMGYEAPGGRPVPLIDRIHRLMLLWTSGDVHKVDEYLDEHGLRRHELFRRVLQSLIELSRDGGRIEELRLLESLSNHIGAKGAKRKVDPLLIAPPEGDDED